MRCFAIALALILSSGAGESLAGQENAAPSWDELRARPFPQWFLDAKLGVFIHWGVYSVPAYSGKEDYAEWFLQGLHVGDTLRTRYMWEHYGGAFEYRDFGPLFTAELFDPHEWASLFRRAGARYVVLVSKHHDGYALWPSRFSPGWNSVDLGPGRDLVGEISEAVREKGLEMGVYYSLAEWDNPLHRWNVDPPESIGRYVDEHMVPQFKELVSAYRPTILFSDGEWMTTAEEWRARELIDWYFDTVGPESVVNDRWGAGSDIGFKTPEYSAGLALTDRPWAEVRGMGRSFGLNRNEALEAYLTPEELVHSFVRAVAAGGGMILNVGPGSDGQIPLLQQERLLQLGSWLEVNGEAIFGARTWERASESEEVRLERVDPAIDFDWVRNGPGRPIREDEFSALWTGVLLPPSSGEYTFEAEADDFIRVWIGDRLMVDQWNQESAEGDPPQAIPPHVSLTDGRAYPIRVEYREEDVNAHARLFWSGADLPREVVPTERFRTEAGPLGQPGLRAEYRSLRETHAYTRKGEDLYVVSFQWPDDDMVISIPAPASGMRVTLLGRDGSLPWRYGDGTLRVDLSAIPFSEIPGDWAWTFKLSGYGADSPSSPSVS